ncbi:RNA recognition family [Cryptosporidium bovis]|uniref:RNA recognition family n=1 Tax=Cryptosporidium bovis TaxID=310047 RepID=UPI00351A8D60|nr:RNA recognition family [Cryptosporidium bovis]
MGLSDKSEGVNDTTKGTAFVVFDDKEDAANALEKLSGFQVSGRYITVLFFNPRQKIK